MGFSRAFCQSILRTRRLYLVDVYAIFHAFAHAIASIDRGTHPGAAISRMVAQFCCRSFGEGFAEPAGRLSFQHLHSRHDDRRILESNLHLHLRHHP